MVVGTDFSTNECIANEESAFDIKIEDNHMSMQWFRTSISVNDSFTLFLM